MVQDWRSLVAQKRAEVAKQLPQEWRLPTEILNTISESANISVLDVPTTCGILNTKEVDITEKHDAVDLIEKMAKKELTASEVTLAFCKRAAIAHQLVSGGRTKSRLFTDLGRPIVSPKCFLDKLKRERNFSMSIWRKRGNLWDLYMGYP